MADGTAIYDALAARVATSMVPSGLKPSRWWPVTKPNPAPISGMKCRNPPETPPWKLANTFGRLHVHLEQKQGQHAHEDAVVKRHHFVQAVRQILLAHKFHQPTNLNIGDEHHAGMFVKEG